ncbi:MAG TPA: PEGA domain-containing protein [Vicinamibacterales bacterium]|nr:PEGA domain-containing protein [Vicinamibacterales bacterium]
MDVSAAKTMGPSDDLLFRDGLGDRLILRDAQGRPSQECLLIRAELASIPAFDFALNERLWLVEKFDHPAFLIVRDIARDAGRLTSISLIHDLTGGTRLSDVLAKAASNGQPISTGATVFVLKEMLDALAELHRQSGDLAHGAIAPERIVLADGKVRIADYVFGPAIEQLRFTTERYWKELRVAVPSAAGGARLDRRVDVVQAALVAVAMFAGRPLRDTEHLGGLGDVLLSISVPQPIRSWLLRALHMDPRRVFVHAGEASQALSESMKEGGVRPAPAELDLQQSRSLRIAPSPAAKPAPPKPITVTTVKPAAPIVKSAPAPTQKRDVWQPHDVDPRQQVTQQRASMPTLRQPVGRGLKRFVQLAAIIGVMTVTFTAAQFIPAPDWMFSQSGTLVIESNPQGIKVSVNGKPQGVTPLTLKVEGGIHQVEMHGPGKPKLFKVHVTRGDRVAQFVEFPGVRR